MLTIEDIRNPKRKSGFNHVNSAKGGSKPNNDNTNWKPRWRASLNGGGRPDGWRGPSRRTPEEAAQDYCDYINGQNVVYNAPLKSAGHKGAPRVERTEEERELRKRLRELEAARNKDRKGYVYLIGEEGSTLAVKVGHSYDPETRPNGLQTGNPRKLIVLASMEGTLEDEAALHQRYIEDNILQEWFKPSVELLAEFDVAWNEYIKACSAGIVREAA